MTDPDLAEQPFVAGPARLEHQIAEMLRNAQAEGELAHDRDADAEAARLLALNHGLSTNILVGQRGAESAIAVLRYHLDRLFRRTTPRRPTS